jgi:hypothetical protein
MRLSPFRILITVRLVEQLAIAPGNTVYGADTKRPAGAHRHATRVRSGVLALRHDRTHEVAGLETKREAAWFGFATRETVPVHPTHPARLPPCGLDNQRGMAGRSVHSLTAFTHTGCVYPMRSGIALPCAVVPGASTGARLKGQTGGFQAPVQRPTGRIDSCRIAQRLFGFLLDFGMAVFLSGLAAFFGNYSPRSSKCSICTQLDPKDWLSKGQKRSRRGLFSPVF